MLKLASHTLSCHIDPHGSIDAGDKNEQWLHNLSINISATLLVSNGTYMFPFTWLDTIEKIAKNYR